jgi:membrane associated rhomboid family serine protease
MELLRKSPVTAALFGVNLVLFLVEEIIRLIAENSLFPILALSRSGLVDGGWWQLVTHGFLHENLLHLIVNMVALWFTGPILEELL